MHADEAAGQREGVERGVAHDEEVEVQSRIAAHRGEALAEAVHILLDLGIVEVGGVAPADLADDLLADAALGRRREFGRSHVAEIGQIGGEHGHRRRQGQGETEQQGKGSAHHRVL